MVHTIPPEFWKQTERLLDEGRFDGARTALSRVAADDPRHPELEYLQGVLAYREGDVEKAGTLFRDLVDRYPAAAKARYALGLAHLQRGQQTQAVDCFLQVLSRSPGHAPARARLSELGIRPPEPRTSAQPAPRPAATPSAVPRPLHPQPPRAVQPDTQPAALRTMVPLAVRLIRLALRIALALAILYTGFIAVAASWALLTRAEDADLQEAAYFGTLATIATATLWLLRRLAGRLGSVTLHGVAASVTSRSEPIGRTRRTRGVLDLTVQPVDRYRHRFAFVPVELRVRHLRGVLGPGERVTVVGMPTRDNILLAREIRSETTGLRFRQRS